MDHLGWFCVIVVVQGKEFRNNNRVEIDWLNLGTKNGWRLLVEALAVSPCPIIPLTSKYFLRRFFLVCFWGPNTFSGGIAAILFLFSQSALDSFSDLFSWWFFFTDLDPIGYITIKSHQIVIQIKLVTGLVTRSCFQLEKISNKNTNEPWMKHEEVPNWWNS